MNWPTVRCRLDVRKLVTDGVALDTIVGPFAGQDEVGEAVELLEAASAVAGQTKSIMQQLFDPLTDYCMTDFGVESETIGGAKLCMMDFVIHAWWNRHIPPCA